MLGSESKAATTTATRDFAATAKQSVMPRKRPSPLTLRLTDEEMQSVKLEAQRHGLNVSAYVRAKVFGTSGVRKNMPAPDRVALGRVLGLLGQSDIAGSLKTLAYEARCGSLLLDEETQAKVETACAQVRVMRDSLIGAIGLREGSRR